MTATNKSPFEHVGDVLNQLKEMRHYSKANVERLTTSLRFADVLLDRAEALGCELLVMGGYGHARVREQLLGGVTRDMLMQAGIPLLMAH